jgi:hypothetical protein
MSNNSYFIRDYTKTNLVDDLIEVFPKLKNSITIPRTDGTFNQGTLVLSNLHRNQYVIFNPKYNIWLIQTVFYNNDIELIFKLINIDDLEFSNFSSDEIQDIKKALTKGVRPKLDFTKISPVFHPINHNQNQFENMFNKPVDANPNFDPTRFLNIPPSLTI